MAEAAAIQGTHPSPARRWLRRVASLAVAAPLLTGLLQGVPAPAAQAAESASGTGAVDVSLGSLAPKAPVEGDTLTITGTVTNRTKQAVTNATVDLRVGPRMTSRSEIDDVSGRGAFRFGGEGETVGGRAAVEIPKLGAGLSRDFSLSVPVSKLGLDDSGVYQLGVSVTGRTTSQSYERVLGIERTFLPYQPDETEKRTKLTYLWPLISTAHVSAETGADQQQTPVFENDDLAAELVPGGRLDEMVALGKDLPVTWVIDPDLLASVDAMASPYMVKDGTTEVPGQNQEVAKRWLDELEKAVQGHKIVALPFADPDLAALAHRGKEVPGSLTHLQQATALAAGTVETVLHVKPSTDFAWPVDGAVDPAVMAVATSAGASNVIARSDSFRDDLPYTPTAARAVGGGTTAVVSDAALSKAFQGDLVRADNSTLAIQSFLAQSLATTLELPEQQRSVVVAPQRMPTTSQAQSMATALQALSAKRWTEPQDLPGAVLDPADPDASTRIPSSRSYPKKLRAQELDTKAFQKMKETRDELDDFRVILTAADRVVPPFTNAISREMSTSWRGEGPSAALYREEVLRYLRSLTEEVQLVKKSDLTLSGRSATIPVTVQNRLLQGVQHLELRISSDNRTRLKLVEGDPVASRPVTIDGGHSQSVKFTASANANGPVLMKAQLYTEDGTPYGAPMTFTVKVSEITPTVMLVIAGGVLLLVLAGIRMYSQRKRAAARRAAAEAEAEAEAEAGAEDGDAGNEDEGTAGTETADPGPEPSAGPGTGNGGETEQPSDPTPNTGSESGDPSGAGEKVDR
ncbi:DUF6049 family protein [Streptomyces laurentii]|uniref:DUF6049 family protein n=1 Tax=Streptomyces laurentii TaxID=39478 RepID=UPI00367E288B